MLRSVALTVALSALVVVSACAGGDEADKKNGSGGYSGYYGGGGVGGFGGRGGSTGTCTGSCGKSTPVAGGRYCDYDCRIHTDCCDDFWWMC